MYYGQQYNVSILQADIIGNTAGNNIFDLHFVYVHDAIIVKFLFQKNIF